MKDRLYQLMDWAKIEALVYSEEDHPEEILGPHKVGSSILYQVFFPFAKKVTLVLEEKQRRIVMEKADDAGYFAALASGKLNTAYHYEILDQAGNIQCFQDPYAFINTLEEKDVNAFCCHVHDQLHTLLGSHLTMINGIKGLRFVTWIPDAMRVSIVGEFNHWDGRVYPMNRIGDTDLFTLFIPGISEHTPYQYEVKSKTNRLFLREDYFARPIVADGKNCSQSYREEDISWKDGEYLAMRGMLKDRVFFYQIQEEELLAPDDLVELVLQRGYTHVILPEVAAAKHFYQFSLCFGSKYAIKELVNRLHQANIGVCLQWNIGKLQKPGNTIYANIHLSNIIYLLEQYHLDGVVFSQLASLLYLDYQKEPGQWQPNIYGGSEHLEASNWLKQTNAFLKKRVEGILLLTDLDAIWPKVTDSLDHDGLGFDYRYDTAFTKDFLSYLHTDPYFRSGIHESITRQMSYAHQEHFIFSFGKEAANLWESLSGEEEERFKTIKMAIAYSTFLPGKMMFSFHAPEPYQQKLSFLINDCCRWSGHLSPLADDEYIQESFHWINCSHYNDCSVSFYREDLQKQGTIVVIANFANADKEEFTLGVPYEGKYKLFFSTEEESYGGKLSLSQTCFEVRIQEWDGFPYSLMVSIPALSVQAYVFIPYTEKEVYIQAKKKADQIRLQLEEEAKSKIDWMKKQKLSDQLAKQIEQELTKRQKTNPCR